VWACTAANRFYAERPVAAEFSRRLAAAMAALPMGNGLDPAVRVGPLVDAATRAKVARLVAAAVAAGIQAAANPAALAPILMRCAMCGDPRELNDLRVIRVCHPHCAETAAPEQERSADG